MCLARLTGWLLVLLFALEIGVHHAFPDLNRHHRPVHYARIALEIVGILLYVKDYRRHHNRWSLVWCGLLFFFAGEESAWGQRYLRYPSPPWFLQHNVQQEVTIHNLNFAGYSTSDLWFYIVFWLFLIACFAQGFVVANESPLRHSLWQVRLPLPTREIAMAACIMLELSLIAPVSHYYVGPFLEATKLTAVSYGILTIYTAMRRFNSARQIALHPCIRGW